MSSFGKTMDEHNRGRSFEQAKAEREANRALAELHRQHMTPAEREASESRDMARECSTDAVQLWDARDEPKFSDGIARKCFTCKGWLGGGWTMCNVKNITTDTHFICADYERHPSKYPALPAGEPTGRVDPRGEE